MNKQIKELADQCWSHRVAGALVDGQLHFDQQKFAELIVRECAEVCYHHSEAAGGVDTAFGYGYKDCGNDIKKHFGVEE
jgi:hypothetical protein